MKLTIKFQIDKIKTDILSIPLFQMIIYLILDYQTIRTINSNDKNLSDFIVDGTSEGLTLNAEEKKLGIRQYSSQLFTLVKSSSSGHAITIVLCF